MLVLFGIGDGGGGPKSEEVTGLVLENRLIRYEFAGNGEILRAFDKEADQAGFDIQYGTIHRNTHRNVSWDMARFEVAAHKYADLSDHNYGVALLNDCKYGHKVLDNVIDLNLLRSPTYPDADADQGAHTFTYSLLPHCGSLIESDVISEATQLNQPPIVLEGYRQENATVPVIVTGEGVALEVLKKAEKEPCHVIRLVERRGCETTAMVTLNHATARLVATDLLEWRHMGTLGAGQVEIAMQPFAIRTFKIVSAQSVACGCWVFFRTPLIYSGYLVMMHRSLQRVHGPGSVPAAKRCFAR